MDTSRRERATGRQGKRAARGKQAGKAPAGKPRDGSTSEGAATARAEERVSRLVARAGVRRAAVGVALGFFVVVAVLVRVVPAWSTVFSGPAGVRLFDTDSYYHLRHAAYAAGHFPHLQPWDPGIYPAGQPKRYAGLFDVVIGGAALVAGGGHSDDRLLTKVAAWTPVVLGVGCVLALFWLAARARAPAAGLVALAVVTLYPGTFVQRSLLGAVDHHVAEVLLALLTALGLWRSAMGAAPPAAEPPTATATAGSGAERGRAVLRQLRPDFLSPLPLVVFLFTWYGAPIYLLLVMVTFSGVGAFVLARDGAARPFARAAFRYGAGVVVTMIAARLLAPGLVMEGAFFRKALLGAAVFTVGLPAFLLAGEALIARVAPATATTQRRRRAAVAVSGGAVAAIAIAVGVGVTIAPMGHQLLGELLGVKTNLVKEQAGVSVGRYAFFGGAPAFLAFLALPLAAVACWRRRDAEPGTSQAELGRLMLASLGTMIVLLWLRTHDYGYVAPPFLAWLATDVLARAGARLRAPRPRVVAGLVAAAIVVGPVWPGGATASLRPDPDVIRELMLLRPGWEEALAWMRTSSPPLSVPLDAPVSKSAHFRHPPGNYGVLAFWDFGHYIAQLGGRPPLASGGISTTTAQWFLIDDEDAAVRALGDGLRSGERVRYCIADAQTAGDFFLAGLQMAGASVNDYIEIFAPGTMPQKRLMRFNAKYKRSMVARLYEDDGADLAHFRLVYASPEQNLLAYHAPLGDGVITRQATRFFDAEEKALWQRSLSSRRPIVLSNEIVYEGRIGPAVKVFEQVPGAHLVGQALPGATVEATLSLVARASGHAFQYRRTGRADGGGRYELVVPYPTESTSPNSDVSAGDAYEIKTTAGGPPGALARARVSSADVEEGRPVTVDAVAPAAADGPAEVPPAAAPARP